MRQYKNMNIGEYDEKTLFRAKRQPPWCSDVRWRIELRRRAQEKRLSHAVRKILSMPSEMFKEDEE